MLLILALLNMPVQAHALGFGAMSIESHLHQTLSVTIPVLLNASDDIKKVRVELANPDEYRQLGLQWQAELAHIRVLFHAKYSAQPRLQLRSSGLIHSPMLSIVLKAQKSDRGTYFKHYQLLLDTVETLAQRGQQLSVALEPVYIDQKGASSSFPEAEAWARVWRYGPVQAGDSLSEIAYRLRVDQRFSNKQVMLSLYENNRAAFGDNDINYLMKGVWLNVPAAEVVEQLADQASMQRLSKLLRRHHTSDALVDAINVDPVKEKARTVDASVKTLAAQTLRYSGKISMQGVAETKVVSALKQGLDQQFDGIHQSLMAGKLQMAKLNETVASLNMSMQVIQQDIRDMKRDIEMIRMRIADTPSTTLMTWPFALIIVLIVMIVVLLVVISRKKNRDEEIAQTSFGDHQGNKSQNKYQQPKDQKARDHQATVSGAPDSRSIEMNRKPMRADINDVSGERVRHAFEPLAEEVIQLLNQVEEQLGQCKFDEAESILHQIDRKWPDSLRALALKAQLYHETDRHQERNDLINSISEASDEQRWEQFCYFLPSHVWNACLGDASTPSLPQR